MWMKVTRQACCCSWRQPAAVEQFVAPLVLALVAMMSLHVSAYPCFAGAQFPLHDAWNSHVVISAQLYGSDGNEKNSWLAVATEYSSFKTRQHAIVTDASLQYKSVQYCLGMGAATYSSSNTLPSWNTTFAKVIYNASDCVYADYEFANQDSGFAWLACNIRFFGFESALCSRATTENPVVPTCAGIDSTGERWEWSWTFQPTGESETHRFWVSSGTYIKYEWSGRSADGCVFNETLTFNDFSPSMDDSWFHEPSFGEESCIPLESGSVSFCSLDNPNCYRPKSDLNLL